ncbi:MAG: Major facilitator family transporter [Paenibacillus sp.]|jgi:DHA2 family metal-tetracycline-proton antiporter-like MFS transporter|nr:Major facilitator family transporter [Paenibacillus sp.]
MSVQDINGLSKGGTGTGNEEKLVKLLCFILLFSVMNVTMFNIALPDIAKHFDLMPSTASWVVTGYSIVYAIGSLTYGKLSDMYPMRTLLTVGLLLFAAGSIIGFMSNNFPLLIAARLIQSAGASSIPALVMLIPIRMFPAQQRGRVIGVLAAAISFAAGVGPIVGGFVSGTLHWRFLFLISIGTLVTLPFLRRWLPDEEVRPGTFDLPGALLLASAVSSLMLSITKWNGWILLVSAVFLALFILRIRMAKQPFIQPSLLRNANYRVALLSGFLAFGASFAIMFITPMMLSHVNLMHTTSIGLIMFPGAMSAALLGRYGGKMADQRGSLFMVFCGLCLMLLGQLTLSSFSGYAVWIIAVCLIFGYIGMSFLQSSMTKLVSTLLPAGQTGVGMGVFTLTNFMAGAVTGAIVSKIIDQSGGSFSLNPLVTQAGASIYSNVFLGLFLITGLNMAIVYLVFGRRSKRETSQTKVTSV